MVQFSNGLFFFYHSISGQVLKWLDYHRAFYAKEKHFYGSFYIKWTFENRSQICPEIEWFRYLNIRFLNGDCI
jgi:hypothetical protein